MSKFNEKIIMGRNGKHNSRVVLKFIKWYIEQYEESPTREDIAEALGYSNTSSVADPLQKLVADGKIEMVPPRSSRNIRVID